MSIKIEENIAENNFSSVKFSYLPASDGIINI